MLKVSIGYFLSDLAMILYNYPDLGGIEYVSMRTGPNSPEIYFQNLCLILVVYLVSLFMKYKNGLLEYLSFERSFWRVLSIMMNLSFFG